MKDLPESLQTPYDALKYLFESTLADCDARDALADLEALVAPYRAAQTSYAAGSGLYSVHPAYHVRNEARGEKKEWTSWPDDKPMPTLMDLLMLVPKSEESP